MESSSRSKVIVKQQQAQFTTTITVEEAIEIGGEPGRLDRLRRVLNTILKNLIPRDTSRDEDEYSKLLKEGGDRKGVM